LTPSELDASERPTTAVLDDLSDPFEVTTTTPAIAATTTNRAVIRAVRPPRDARAGAGEGAAGAANTTGAGAAGSSRQPQKEHSPRPMSGWPHVGHFT
jgi:hypothetical protein